MADKPATPQRDDMAAVALDTVLLDEEPTADQVLTAVLVLMDFVAYAGAAAMLWINREFLMLHGTNAVTLPIATAIFVVTINFVRGLLIAARFLTAYACKGYTASCALAAACVALASRLGSPSDLSRTNAPSKAPSVMSTWHPGEKLPTRGASFRRAVLPAQSRSV